METMEPFESMKEVENGSPGKECNADLSKGLYSNTENILLIVGIPLVLCSTYVGRSLQVYLVLEKVSISNQRFSSFYTMITTSCMNIRQLQQHDSRQGSLCSFKSNFQNTNIILSTHLGYFLKYFIYIYTHIYIYLVIIVNSKDHEIFGTSNWPNLELGTNQRSNSGGLALRPQPALNQTAMFQRSFRWSLAVPYKCHPNQSVK